MNGMVTTVIDFDGVILNTDVFKKAYFSFLREAVGIDPKKTYLETKSGGYYNIDQHHHLLTRQVNRDSSFERALRRQTEDFLVQQIHNSIFADAQELLVVAGRAGKIVILTRGTRWFQEAKIAALGIKVDKVITVQNESKSSVFRKIVRSDTRVFFIEDTVAEIVDVKIEFPQVITILVGRKGKEDCEKADYIVGNLSKAADIIAV